MKREKIVKELLEIGGFCLLMAVLLFAISPIFVPKWIDSKFQHVTQIVRGFYAERKDSLDVVFIGDSNIYNGVSPQELWGDYGIASYDFAVPAACAWTNYYYFEEMMKYQHPQVAVLDVNGLTCAETQGEHRKIFDNLPLSENKIRAMNDERYGFSMNGKIGMIFQVIPFHSRFVELNSDDLRYAYSYEDFDEKGYNLTTQILPYEGGDYMLNMDTQYELPAVAVEYFDKIVERAKQEDIQLILISVPSTKAWNLTKSVAAQNYASAQGLPYLDLNSRTAELGLDWRTDTFDHGEHMNLSGAQKVTHFMGEYLKRNYELPDRREDAEYRDWKESYGRYLSDKEMQ